MADNMKTLYTDIEINIKANGHIARPIRPTRGVRKGCPLSMTLYIMEADMLLRYIEQNKTIKGITLNKNETKITAYADDTLFYIKGKSSLLQLNTTLKHFELATGTKLNRNKCQGIWIGKDHQKTTEPLNFVWREPILKMLGLTFNKDGRDQLQDNWTPIFQKMTKTIQKWKRHNLSLKGKILILNTLVMSKLWHTAQVLRLPDDHTLKDLNNTIYDYIWNNAKTRINKKQLQQPTKEARLGLIDIETKAKALQARWAAKILSNSETAP